MGKEIVKCKVLGLSVNKTTRCPDYTCDNCPEASTKIKQLSVKQPQIRTFNFSPEERKIFASPETIAVKIYDFLTDFIKHNNESLIREFYFHYRDFEKFLQNLPLLKKPYDSYIEKIYNLSVLLSKHSRQRKNIPLDCFLLAFKRHSLSTDKIKGIKKKTKGLETESKWDPEDISDIDWQRDLKKIDRALSGRGDIKKLLTIMPSYNAETLKKRLHRVCHAKYIEEIYDLAFWLLAGI